MRKVIEFIKKYSVEVSFVVVALLLLFLPYTPYALKTFCFGIFFATLLDPLIKYIIKRNTEE